MHNGMAWLLALVWACMAATAGADPAAAGQAELTREHCLLCHGSTGQGNAAVGAPRLTGLQPWYVRRQLQAFRTGSRGTHAADENGAAMKSVALAMPASPASDALIEDVTHLPQQPVPFALDGDVTRGRVLYSACASCHGTHGEGNEALAAPALAALNDWYIAVQLQHFRDGTRGSADGDVAGAQMRAAATAGLPDDAAIADLAAYISRLPADASVSANAR